MMTQDSNKFDGRISCKIPNNMGRENIGKNTKPYKNTYTYNIRDLYQKYRNRIRGNKRDLPENTLPYKKYKKFVLTLFKEMFNDILFKSKKVNLPHNLGSLYTYKYGRKHHRLKYLGDGKYVKYIDPKTNGYIYKHKWDKSSSKISDCNRPLYDLIFYQKYGQDFVTWWRNTEENLPPFLPR